MSDCRELSKCREELVRSNWSTHPTAILMTQPTKYWNSTSAASATTKISREWPQKNHNATDHNEGLNISVRCQTANLIMQNEDLPVQQLHPDHSKSPCCRAALLQLRPFCCIHISARTNCKALKILPTMSWTTPTYFTTYAHKSSLTTEPPMNFTPHPKICPT